MLIKIRRKIRCGIRAEGDDSSAQFFQGIIICVISRTRNLQLHKRKTDDIIKIKIKGLFDVIIGGNNMSENQVKITYKPLWKLLIDRDMTKTELRKKTQIAPSTFTKMNNDQQVSLDILARICVELKCGFDDIVEIER